MALEQTKNDHATPAQGEAEATAGDQHRKNDRSTIEFPYSDLDSAVEIAKAISTNAGTACTLDQLAAYLKKAVSGPFRVRLSNARMFGITANERGQVQLTPLGRQIADPATELQARADAFLSVELYKTLYEKYRNFTLPGPKGLEQEMVSLGVATNQSDKARQAFMRSAKQSGFFAHGEDRLVKPSFGATPLTRPVETATDGKSKDKKGNGDGDEPPLDPLLRGLVDRLPPADSDWSLENRVKWLQTAANIFDLIYKGGGGIKIEPATAQRSPRPE